jgi:hypothetical protein
MSIQGWIGLLIFAPLSLFAQLRDTVDGRVITLSEIVIRKNTDVRGFVEKVKKDTSFYKAFKNLRILEFTSYNDIRMFDRKGRVSASLQSHTRQERTGNCRVTKKINEETTGDFYAADGSYNYYTAALYSSLFWSFTPVCGETNKVESDLGGLSGLSGTERHKQQLKMLFFNPGMRIPGIPLMGDKAALFDDDMSKWYNFSIDIAEKGGHLCYVFTVTGKTREEGGDPGMLVIDRMTTWFDYTDFDVLSRNYALSYKAGVYSFDVDMDVELSRYKGLLVPSVIRYNGGWKVITRKKEQGVFTATLTDFAGR